MWAIVRRKKRRRGVGNIASVTNPKQSEGLLPLGLELKRSLIVVDYGWGVQEG
jgi:hypothetical protein